MNESKSKQLFLSHASEDAAMAAQLCDLLEARGISCWIAPRDIPKGGEYDTEILKGIRACAAMAVLVSPDAMTSKFVRIELERASSLGKRLFPIFLKDVEPCGHVEFFLSSLQRIEAWKQPLARTADELVASLGADESPAPSISSPPRKRRIWGLAVALAAVVSALFFGVRWMTRLDTSRGTIQSHGGEDARSQPLRYHAIVIGVNAYQPLAGEGWAPLRTARQDAEAVASMLESDYGFSVRRVLDADATAKGIMVALDELSQLGPADAVLVFYAGHGYYDEQQDEGYWIPVDARRAIDGRPAKEDWLWNSIITRLLDVSRARHVLLIADACYSGSLFRGEKTDQQGHDDLWYERASAEPSRYLITSGGYEPVLDGTGDHSVFAGELTRFLREQQKPMFSAPEIAFSIREKVARLTGQMVRSGPMALSAHAGGEFVFTRRGTAPPSVPAEPVAPGTPAGNEEERARSALALVRQGATNTAARLAGAAATTTPDPLARALADYMDVNQQKQRADNLRELIRTLGERAGTSTNALQYQSFARPRVVACLGPRASAGVDDDRAALYRLALRTQLEESGEVRVIERDRLEEVLRELQIGQSDLADARAGAAIGKLLPASVLLLGDVVADQGGEYLYLRLVDAETSQVVASFEQRRPPQASVMEACRPLASNILQSVKSARPLEAGVFERHGNRLVAGIGSFHGARKGAQFMVLERANRILGGVRDVTEQPVGQARVVSIGNLSADLDAAWSGDAPAADAELWIREPGQGDGEK